MMYQNLSTGCVDYESEIRREYSKLIYEHETLSFDQYLELNWTEYEGME